MKHNSSRNTVILTGLAALGFAGALLGGQSTRAHAQTFLSASYFGGAGTQVATGVSVGADGVYVSGNSGNTLESLAAKFALTPGSSPIWWTVWPGGTTNPGESFGGVTVTSEGVYFAGYSYLETTDNIGGKEPKSVLVKFPTAGPTGPAVGGATWFATPIFFPDYQGGEGLSAVTNVVEGGQTYLYATGIGQANFNNDTAVLTKYDESGNQQWQVSVGNTSWGWGGNGAGVASLNGYIYVASVQSQLSAASSNAILSKYDTAGNVVWSVSYGGVNGAYASAVATQGSNIYVTGALYNGPYGGLDVFVRCYDEQGNLVWSQIKGGPADDVGNGIAVQGNNVYVVGTTASYSAGVTDAFLATLNATTGTVDNILVYGGAVNDGANGVAVSGNDLYVAGYTSGSGNNAMLLHYSLGTISQLTAVKLSPDSVTGGRSATGTVTLSAAAPTGGTVISLGSSNTSLASVPASVTVPAGGTTATFTITTNPVAATSIASISASFGGVSSSAGLIVNPASISTLSLNPTTVKGGAQNSTATITLSGKAPTGGLVVTLISSDVSTATVPATVTVPAGSSTVTFTVTTHKVTETQNPVILATTGTVDQSATLTVTP